MNGTIYLIHIEEPIGNPGHRNGQAQHYIGWAKDLDSRLKEHRAGRGSAILAHCRMLRRSWKCVRTWTGDRHFERRLKNRKNAPLLCPVCNPSHALDLAQYEGHDSQPYSKVAA